MIELARHIEWLLQDNECVIVPGLGGFIAHYTPAQRVDEENRFLPPMRIIGFNPQLKLNDGLLVQSYMAVHNVCFTDASRMLEKDVDKLLTILHECGKASIGNIGELFLSIRNVYTFIPFDNKLSVATLYGLGSFEMDELKALKQPAAPKVIPVHTSPSSNRTSFDYKFNPSFLINAAAMIAVIVLFFFLPTPTIKNTEILTENYAQLLPDNLFEKMEKHSLAITPIAIKELSHQTNPAHRGKPSNENVATQRKKTPVAVKEVKVPKAEVDKTPVTTTISVAPAPVNKPQETTKAAPSKRYHIIIASVGTEKDAKAMAEQLQKNGYPNAKAIIGDGKKRVSIESYETETEAYRHVHTLRKNETYQNAWVLKR